MSAETSEDKASQTRNYIAYIAGSAQWDSTYRSNKNLEKQDLCDPHRIELPPIKDFFTGPTSCHNIVLCDDGSVFVFGRNESGQLGLGDTNTRFGPVKHSELSQKLVMAATGRSHSLFLMSDNKVLACGESKLGQCGTNKKQVLKPMLVKMPTSDKIKKVACGGQFSLILTESGNIWAFGSPAYGQLGQNDDGQRIVSAGRVELDYKSSPVQIGGILKNKKIIDIACGDNHSLALDSDGAIYSWGRGDDGRLGHRDQVNQLVPKLVEELATDSRNVGVKSIACGEGISLAVSGMGQIFIWGKYRKTDANMYPKPIFDLMGWTIRSFAAGKVGIMISAEYHPSNKSLPSELEVISWGQGIVHGELCRGEGNPKNCAQLAEVQAFKGLDVELIVCGLGHTVFLLPDTDKNIKALSEEKFADWLPLDQTGDLEATNLNSNPGASSSKQLKKVGKRGAEEPTNAGKKKTRKSPT